MNDARTRRAWPAVAALLTLALTAAACGAGEAATGGDRSTTTTAPPATTAPSTTTTSEAPTTTTAAPTTTTEAVDDGIVAVTAFDFGYEGLPASIPTGSTFTLVNASETELHEMVVFQLSSYEARTLDEIVQLPPDRLERTLGPPSAVILAPPGGAPSITVVGDGRLRGTGRYAVFCFIPIGADVDEYLTKAATSDGPPQVAGGPPHFTAGMFTEVLVTGS